LKTFLVVLAITTMALPEAAFARNAKKPAEPVFIIKYRDPARHQRQFLEVRGEQAAFVDVPHGSEVRVFFPEKLVDGAEVTAECVLPCVEAWTGKLKGRKQHLKIEWQRKGR